MNRYSEQELTPIDKIATFWNWFASQAPSYRELLKANADVEDLIFEPLGEALSHIQKDIFFLLGYKDSGEAELILTADGNIKNMYLIDALIQHAPDLPHWKFIGHKKAMELENLHISIGAMEFNKDTIFFQPIEHENYPDLIDIEIYYTQFDPEEINAVHQGIFIFLDNFIGELNFVKLIDQIIIVEEVPNIENLVPISKLKDYLNWREKEFVENYQEQPLPEEFHYSLMSAELQNGAILLAIINTDALQWETKAAFPWIGIITLHFELEEEGQFPNEATQEALEQIENKLCEHLNTAQEAIHIGRQTIQNKREIYFVAKDYNTLAKVFYASQQEHESFRLESEIYKDKYWRTFDKFQPENI